MNTDLLITNARLLEHEGLVDIRIADGAIVSVGEGGDQPAARTIDAGANLVVPPFADPHFHLDKTLSRGLLGATSYREAFDRAREVKMAFTVADVEERACTALRLAASHGIGLVRAQVDVDSFTGLVSLEGVLAARERYRHAVDVEVVAFPQEGIVCDPKTPELLREAARMGVDAIGGLPEFEASVEDQRRHLEVVFDIAEQADLPLDLHIDYTDDPQLKTLAMVTEMTVARGLQGRVQVDHVCALAVYPDDEAARVIDEVRNAELRVVVLPMANLQLLGGKGRTPVNRGSSRLLELRDAGVPVAAGSDNMFDIWYRFNRMDPLELALITCLSGGMRTDEEVEAAFDMVNAGATELLGRPRPEVRPGAAADLVVLCADSIVDALRNIPGPRQLIRRGRVVAGLHGGSWTADRAE